jgi:hypothetical protein
MAGLRADDVQLVRGSAALEAVTSTAHGADPKAPTRSPITGRWRPAPSTRPSAASATCVAAPHAFIPTFAATHDLPSVAKCASHQSALPLDPDQSLDQALPVVRQDVYAHPCQPVHRDRGITYTTPIHGPWH